MLRQFLVLLICTSLALGKVELPSEFKKTLDKLHGECLEQQKLTEDDFKAFDINQKNPTLMCYMKCLFTRFKWMDDNENLQYDYIKTSTPENTKEIITPNLELCGQKAIGSNECEKSYNFYYCMYQAHPEDWGLI